MSDSLQPHGLQHARLPCPSLTPGAYLNLCPLSWWCHPTISSSVLPFSSRLQSFPSSGSFQKSQFFISGGQSINVSASTSVLPMNIQGWFPLGLMGWLSLQSQECPPTPQLPLPECQIPGLMQSVVFWEWWLLPLRFAIEFPPPMFFRGLIARLF